MIYILQAVLQSVHLARYPFKHVRLQAAVFICPLFVCVQPLSTDSTHVRNAVGDAARLGLHRRYVSKIRSDSCSKFKPPPPPPINTDNYVHRIVQNKSDGKLVEVAGQQGLVSDDGVININSLIPGHHPVFNIALKNWEWPVHGRG